MLSRSPPPTLASLVVSKLESLYLVGFVPLVVYTEVVNKLMRPAGQETTFLPLMWTSVWCALGMGWAWVRLGWEGMTSDWTDERERAAADAVDRVVGPSPAAGFKAD